MLNPFGNGHQPKRLGQRNDRPGQRKIIGAHEELVDLDAIQRQPVDGGER